MGIRGSLRLGNGVALLPHFTMNLGRGHMGLIRGRKKKYDLENLAKLFPAEAAAALPLAMSIGNHSVVVRLILIGLILALVVLLRYAATQPKRRRPTGLGRH
jgi:hypothetical protein